MKILTVSTIFILVSSTLSYPSKPLDERSTELTWQAWLLVDDQNQNKQYNEGGNVKKKVIAKSVFIVPTFNPEKLPPCAEGYASDSMGRCLEVFQVDAKNQLRFLLNKLQSHLESNHKTSSGPEKFTIEIPENDSGNDDTSAALVLTQNPKSNENGINMIASNGNSNLPKTKVEEKNPEEGMETIISTPTTSVTTETETEITTIDPASMEVFSTISSLGDERETTDPTVTILADDETTEMMPITFITTEDNRQAIFFKIPTTTTQKNEQSSEFSLSSRIQFQEDAFSNDQPSTQDSTNLDYVNRSKVIFKHQLETAGDLQTSENVRHTTNVIRFPDDHQNVKHNSQNFNFQNDHLEHSKSYSHRNRDKNFWRLRPTDHNSFVVTLSNTHFRDLLVQNRHSSPMYRQIPTEHLSYIFGRTNNKR